MYIKDSTIQSQFLPINIGPTCSETFVFLAHQKILIDTKMMFLGKLESEMFTVTDTGKGIMRKA